MSETQQEANGYGQTFTPPGLGQGVDESLNINELAAALAKAQGMMESAKKDAFNPHFKSRYADLAAIWDAARKPLSANGLAVLQRVSNSTAGVVITTMLVHSSGQWVRDRCEWPVAQNTPQGMGSAITYGKKYAFAALVGVAADDDDDGNAASAGPQRPAANGNGSRTDQVKAQLKATPWEQISALLAKAGKHGDDAAKFVKGVTNKPDRASLTEADVLMVDDALAALRQQAQSS